MTEAESGPYTLIYHAGIPGRAEFVRVYLEATGTPYTDAAREQGQKCIAPFLKDGFPGCDDNPTPFAPPILQHGSLVISQTSNILLYLAGRLPAIDLTAAADEPSDKKRMKFSPPTLDSPALFHANELTLSILDCVNEAHDTHHPLRTSDYYENQKEAASEKAKDFRELRIPKFFAFLERNLKKVDSGYLLKEVSYADLALFQLVDGLLFAFPKAMAKQKLNFPLVFALYDKVKEWPRISKYLKSERRAKYSLGIFRHYPELDEPEE